MAEAESETDAARCRALTADGERCSRTAGDGDFCHQHDESDPTVDEGDDAAPAGDQNEGDDTMSTETTEAEAEEQDESAAETDQSEETSGQAESGVDTEEQPVADVDASSDEGTDEDASSGGADLWDARETAERVANELIDDPFDGIIEISRQEDGGGWTGVVEVIERRAIPDTQDILGRYEVSIGQDGGLEGYRLTGRYRRGDVSDEQAPDQ